MRISDWSSDVCSSDLLPFMDRGNLHLRDLHPQTNQGVAADAIATLEGISRTALDELAVESQRRAAVAIEEGRFDKSLVPVLNEDGTVALDRAAFPRPGTPLASLASLPSSFEKLADLPLDPDGNPYRPMLLTKLPRSEQRRVVTEGVRTG